MRRWKGICFVCTHRLPGPAAQAKSATRGGRVYLWLHGDTCVARGIFFACRATVMSRVPNSDLVPDPKERRTGTVRAQLPAFARLRNHTHQER